MSTNVVNNLSKKTARKIINISRKKSLGPCAPDQKKVLPTNKENGMPLKTDSKKQQWKNKNQKLKNLQTQQKTGSSTTPTSLNANQSNQQNKNK